MAGIYIHVPFCRKKCHYCDFYKITLTGLIPSYVEAVKKELAVRSSYTQGESIESIYFGGGTPSLLSAGEISGIINAIAGVHRISADCEITLEANPDDIYPGFLAELRERTVVNRISLGIQSFYDDELTLLNRRHDAQQAFKSIEECLSAGFSNLSIDLIYGIPGLSQQKWENNIHYAANSGAVHISAYHLSIEPGTKLHRMLHEGMIIMADEETGRSQYDILCNILNREGFRHYEISNFCREGFYAVHNTNYWKQKIYLGLGPSAHSFDLHSRQWNLPGVKKYIRTMVDEGITFYGREDTDRLTSYNEYIMLSLRTIWGADQDHIRTVYGEEFVSDFEVTAEALIISGHMKKHEGKYILTEDAWFVSDGIIKKFLKF